MKENQYTDTQLKQALAKMLPEKLMIVNKLMHPVIPTLMWKGKVKEWDGTPVRDTELLHLCWMVEEDRDNLIYYSKCLTEQCGNPTANIHATWQQRTIALAKVKGVEIV